MQMNIRYLLIAILAELFKIYLLKDKMDFFQKLC